ncbi:MAG: L,D-transpeptidase family protein [Eubacteriales bacterium]|nr:L,D-transpeptidase family protein [Eubacteriales bacterium]
MEQKRDELKKEEKQKSSMLEENYDEILDFDAIKEQDLSEIKKEKDDKTTEKEKTEEKKAEEKKEDSKAEEKKAEEKKKEDSKTEEKKIEEKKKDDSKAEEKEADHAKKDKNSKSSKPSSESKKLADIKAAEEKKQSEKQKEGAKEEKKKDATKDKKKSKKGIMIAFASFAGVLLIGYFVGVFYFFQHFYQAVTINGVNVSGTDKAYANQLLNDFYKNYQLNIALIDGTEEIIKAQDIAMEISLKDDLSTCIKGQNPFLWFVNYFKKFDFLMDADAKWDEQLLNSKYDSWKFFEQSNMEKPENAYVGVEDGKFVIVKEKNGSTLYVNQAKSAIEDTLSKVVPTVDLVEQDCYFLPEIKEDNEALKQELDSKNVYAENEIKLQLDDLLLEPGMELYEQVLEKKGNDYVISEAKVQKYVADLAKEYDTLGTDRQFTTSWSKRKILTHGEKFGYLMNQDETTKALTNALNAKRAATVEAIFDNKGYTLQGENDIGDTYIEVNLSEQHVYAYKNGRKIADGDCVSGCEAAGHGTCIGLYAIQNKLSPTVLRGEKKPVTKTVKKKVDGKTVEVKQTSYEYEYESPVTYWMQFNGGIGLHDAAGWRSAYGGSIYYYSGSHGCVNLPLSFAKELYSNFDVDTPVIVYFWDNANRK